MKKILCVMLALIIAAGVFATVPAAAADISNSATGTSGKIYFDASGWKNFTKIYCHIWEIGGKSFQGWQTPAEECKKESGVTYSYDLSKLDNSQYISGGLKDDGKYGVIFSANTGVQTYDLTIGTECKGDTAELTGNKIENPVISEKVADEAVWQNSSSKYGPHLALTSIGNIVGSKLAPGERGIQVVGDWVATYYNSENVDAVKALKNAYPKFGIKTVDALNSVYAYVKAKGVGSSELREIKDILEKAFKAVYPDQMYTDISKWTVNGIKNKTYTGKAIKQSITVTKSGKKATFNVKYSNNVNAGKAAMVITGTGNFKGTIKKTFTINKAANTLKVSSAIKTVKYAVVTYTSVAAKPVTVAKAKGKVTFKKASGSKALTVKSNGSIVVKKGTKKGLYSAKVKVTAKGDKNHKPKTSTVTAKIVVY